MAVVVQKYGGSSVADAQKLRKVAERVIRTRNQGHQVVVVVSAMGNTTDELLAMAKQISVNPERRELDMLLSAGERISMALLSMAIRELGGDAISLTGSQSGIITNDRHVDARIIEVRPFRVQDALAQGKIVVVAGFQGVSHKKEVTTLGRGGSDTTAVAMAAALDADYCEICSDVDGVYSADPRVVPAAQAHCHAVVRGDAGDGRGGRKGAERAGSRVRQREGDRHLCARDRWSASRTESVERWDGRTGTPVPGAGERRRRCQRARRDPPRKRSAAADLLALLDDNGVAGKQLHIVGTRTQPRDLAREPSRRGAAA